MARKPTKAVASSEVIRLLRSISVQTRVCHKHLIELVQAIDSLRMTRLRRQHLTTQSEALQMAMKTLDLELMQAKQRHAPAKPRRAGRLLVAAKRFTLLAATVIAGGL